MRRPVLLALSLVLLAAAPTGAGQNRERAEWLQATVRRQWRATPAELPSQARLQSLAATLRQSPAIAYAALADADGDGQPDLLAVPEPPEPRPYQRGPVMIFRFPDLAAGKVQAHRLPSAGDFRAVERVADVNGDGRPEVVVTYETHGSGGIVPWLFYRWDGRRFERIFDAYEDHWRGPNEVRVEPGRVIITCRPLGLFDQKFAPHRQHTENWVWDGSAYRMASHIVPPPPTDRQGLSDAEAYFRRQEYGAALPLFRRALALPQEESGRWQPLIRLRIGQARALLKGLPPGSVDQLPPEVAIQAALTRGDFSLSGLPVAQILAVDLDGDGRQELWVRLKDPAQGGTPAYLAVKTPAGWRVGPMAGWESEPQIRHDRRGAVLLFDGRKEGWAWPDRAIIGWNGHEVTHVNEGGGRESRWQHPLLEPAVPPCRKAFDHLVIPEP